MKKSSLEQNFAALWEQLFPSIPLVREVQGIPNRRFRFDFAHLTSKVAIEINGGIWLSDGGHSSGVGIKRDYEKNNLAISTGWVVFQLSADMVTRDWLKLIEKAIQERENG